MATSGTYTFSVSRDDLINSALRLVGAIGAADTASPLDITDCALALNMVAKEIALSGIALWCRQKLVVPMVAGQVAYDLSTVAGAGTLPLQILDTYVHYGINGNDRILQAISLSDYNSLGYKLSEGTPTQYYYDVALGAGTITTYPAPTTTDASEGNQLIVYVLRQVQDFNLATDTPDFPQEAYRLLKWALADEIALEYLTPLDVRKEINQRANSYRERFMSSQQEHASVIFTPTTQQGVRG